MIRRVRSSRFVREDLRAAAVPLTQRRDVERTALVVSAAGLVGYSVLAFFGSWVP